jgi:hypothetical protein
MNFSEENGKLVAEILADFCELTGAILDEDKCVAETTFEGAELTKHVTIEFINVNVKCTVNIEIGDLSGERLNMGLYDNDDNDVIFELGDGEYDKNELAEAFKSRTVEKGTILDDEYKSKIAGFISDSEYDVEGTISYKL